MFHKHVLSFSFFLNLQKKTLISPYCVREISICFKIKSKTILRVSKFAITKSSICATVIKTSGMNERVEQTESEKKASISPPPLPPRRRRYRSNRFNASSMPIVATREKCLARRGNGISIALIFHSGKLPLALPPGAFPFRQGRKREERNTRLAAVRFRSVLFDTEMLSTP